MLLCWGAPSLAGVTPPLLPRNEWGTGERWSSGGEGTSVACSGPWAWAGFVRVAHGPRPAPTSVPGNQELPGPSQASEGPGNGVARYYLAPTHTLAGPATLSHVSAALPVLRTWREFKHVWDQFKKVMSKELIVPGHPRARPCVKVPSGFLTPDPWGLA